MEQSLQSPAASFSPLLCINRIDETSDAATFEFRAIDSTPFDYKPGQFITFQVDVADEQLHRAYSLSSTPSRPETVSITVKRVVGGKVSNFLIDNLKPGYALQAMPPAGEFNIIDRSSTRQVVLLSAGSGITPCISIARWLLDQAADVDIQFIYSARSEADVIMRDELAQLAHRHGNFHLHRVLDEVESDSDHQGMLDEALFNRLLPDLSDRTLFTCGPQAYMAAIESFAQARGFDMTYFHKESFVPLDTTATTNEDAAEHQITVPQFGKSNAVQAGDNLLSALETAGVPIIAACRSGVCGSCKCKVAAGEVDSTSQATLSDDEIAAGYVLACSSTVKTDLAVEL